MSQAIRRGMTRWELSGVFVVVLLLAPVFTLVLTQGRERSYRAKCADNVKRIVIAQTNFGSIGAASKGDRYLVGPREGMLKPIRCIDPSGQSKIYADASRAFIGLFMLALIDTPATYACPSDPFVAVLDATGRRIPTPPNDPYRYEDFPVEGTPTTEDFWASADSPAATETGHTFYSYSQQSRSPNVYSSLSPKMDPKIPVAGERNPYSVTNVLTNIGSPTDGGHDTGNAWAHNREGGNVAYMDARVEFIPDARYMRLAVDPKTNDTAGYAYLYANATVSATAPTGPASGSCPPRGPTTPFPVPPGGVPTAGYAYLTAGDGWGVWLTD